MDTHLAWAVETSRDGESWRFLGKAYTNPGEPLLIHGLPQFVRYRRLDPDGPWSAPLERNGNQPLALIDLEAATRTEIWPDQAQAGVPVLLPPGEVGRLLRFERSEDGELFTWAVEFRGKRRQG